MNFFFFLFFLLNAVTIAEAKIFTKLVQYKTEGVTMNGYIAYEDSSPKKRAGILVVHEWWGHNEYARMRARSLAKLGYTAFAIDMYGNGKTANHPKKAGEYMQASFKNWGTSKARFNKALEILRAHKTVDPEKIASIGYCFGGTVSLKMALSGAELDGVVAFHSALPLQPPVSQGKIKTSLLVINGSEDAFLKPRTAASFIKGIHEANIDLTYINLKGIKHSYTNPKADEFNEKFKIGNLKYDKQADERSWLTMQQFFKRIFN